MKKQTVCNDVYAEIKAELKEEFKNTKKVKGQEVKYPTSMNSLSQAFIVYGLAQKLCDKGFKEDAEWLVKKRNEFLAATKKVDGETVKVQNWFPAFRSAVGKKFFPEFGASKSSARKKDEYGDFLSQLIADVEG